MLEISWAVEADEPGRYIRLEESIERFRQMAENILEQEYPDLDRVPVTIVLSSVLATHGRLSTSRDLRVLERLAEVWRAGDWCVYQDAEETPHS